MSDATIASLVNGLTSNRIDPSIGIAVLKKALDSDSETAAALINALPQVSAPGNLPAHLGQNINTTA